MRVAMLRGTAVVALSVIWGPIISIFFFFVVLQVAEIVEIFRESAMFNVPLGDHVTHGV